MFVKIGIEEKRLQALVHNWNHPSRNLLRLIQNSCITPQSAQPLNTSRSVAVLTAGALVERRDEISGSEMFGRIEPLVAMCILWRLDMRPTCGQHTPTRIHKHTHTQKQPRTHPAPRVAWGSFGALFSSCSLSVSLLGSIFSALLLLQLLVPPPASSLLPSCTTQTLGSVAQLNFCRCRSAHVRRVLPQSLKSPCPDLSSTFLWVSLVSHAASPYAVLNFWL